MASNPVPQPVRRQRSIAGPIVLITVGVLLLLANTGVLTWTRLDFLFERYWPVLIIFWGVIKLFEYFIARQRGYAAPGIGAGGVVLIVFLVLFGLGLTGVHHAVGDWNHAFGDWNWNWSGNTYDMGTDEAQQPIKPGATVQVASTSGDISINTWDQNQIKVVAHRRVAAENQTDAKSVADATRISITANAAGDRVTVDSATGPLSVSRYNVTNSFEIFVPRNVAVDLTTRRGDIAVHSRTGTVKAASARGNINIEDVTGNAELTAHRGDLRIDRISGDVSVSGSFGNAEITGIDGAVRLDADVTGSLHMAKISKGLQFTSSRTDLHIARLEGELSIDGSDLHASQTSGPLTLTTRSKNIRLDDVSGDLRVTTSNGSVNISASKLPLGNIEVNDHRGEVQLMLPARSNFYLQATTTHGDIQSDFGGLNTMNQSRVSTATGSVGNGGPRVQVITDGGDIQIRKST
jgi:hypothetical protein